MHQFTRRAVLAGGSAAAATAFTTFSAIRPATTAEHCLRPLPDFLAEARAQSLTVAQRDLIVTEAIKLLDGFYVHLPLKRKLYGIDPVGALQQLRQQASQMNDDTQFHNQMMTIFTSLRDMHTCYRPPRPYTSAHAFIPLKVETCVEGGRRKYIVSRVAAEFATPTLQAGTEALSWNGVPIEQAAEAAGGEGGNPSARHALGLARLTYRALELQPAPEGTTVLVHYRAGGKEFDTEIAWQVLTQQRSPDEPDACGASCNEVQQIQELRRFLYAPYDFCDAFGPSERIVTRDGEFGYIRIFSFDKAVMGTNKLVDEFKRRVAAFRGNTRGLIVDVRDNGGGSIRASERIVQWVAPKIGRIEPSQLYFRATDLTLRFCQLGDAVRDLGPGQDGLEPWVPSIKQALQTGGTFSDGVEYTNKDDCNVADRVVFPCPVIVVTSGLTWSAAEFFAAGFQDHAGLVLGIDETTGGGGANFRQLSELNDYFGTPAPFEDLTSKANGAGFQLAFRRAKRVGLGAGTEIEDVGVRRNFSYSMTRADLLYGNRDLKRKAAILLAQMN